MEYLFSNYPPLKTGYRTFADTFYDLVPRATQMDIAVGYITSDSLIELKKMIELNSHLKRLNLTIGMHYFDPFTKLEYNAALELNDFLKKNKIGSVRLVTPFRYHGKLYSYSDDNSAFAGIIGSNNLSSIVGGGTRIYESSVLLDDVKMAKDMRDFIERLVKTSTDEIDNLKIDKFREVNPLLDGHEHVEKVDTQTILAYTKTDVSFDIPIKGSEVSAHSNLNVFFGKGRQGKNGLVKPRHWYEVELIVPKGIATRPGYPRTGTVFKVITDDGWTFSCRISGDYNKNFRSEKDLKILGKWLKGRLENAGVLKVGEPVTNETLEKYGRNTFTLTQTKTENVWLLDFGVSK